MKKFLFFLFTIGLFTVGPGYSAETDTLLSKDLTVTASHSDDMTLAGPQESHLRPPHSGEGAKMAGNVKKTDDGSQKTRNGDVDEIGQRLGEAIAYTIRSMFIAQGLFSISSLLIVFFAKKAWRLDIRVWLVACAGIAVAIIGCARLVIEFDFIHNHLNPFILISSLLLWSLIFAVCGYGWRRGFVLSLLLSFSYSFWMGVYDFL